VLEGETILDVLSLEEETVPAVAQVKKLMKIEILYAS
jgi:hypothetical protein